MRAPRAGRSGPPAPGRRRPAAARPPIHDIRPGAISSTSPASSPANPVSQRAPKTASGTQVAAACTASTGQRYRSSSRRGPGRAYNSGSTNRATAHGTWLIPIKAASVTFVTSSRHMTARTNAVARRGASAAIPASGHAPSARRRQTARPRGPVLPPAANGVMCPLLPRPACRATARPRHRPGHAECTPLGVQIQREPGANTTSRWCAGH